MKTWSDFVAASTQQILAWAEQQTWAHDMANCRQDAEWHAEGTSGRTRAWSSPNRASSRMADAGSRAQLTLLFTTLFHDSGKPATTLADPDTGRTRACRSTRRWHGDRFRARELGCNLRLRKNCRIGSISRADLLISWSNPTLGVKSSRCRGCSIIAFVSLRPWPIRGPSDA